MTALATMGESFARFFAPGGDRWSVVQANMIEALRTMPTASCDALISDPPYSSGGAFRGDRMIDTTSKYVQSGQTAEALALRPDFAGDNRDQRSFEYWCVLWLAECLRIVKPGGICALFTDWRQLPTTTDAIQAGGWVWRGIVPWNKTEATRPQMGRPRNQCEYVVWGSAGALDTRESVGVLPGWLDHPAADPLMCDCGHHHTQHRFELPTPEAHACGAVGCPCAGFVTFWWSAIARGPAPSYTHRVATEDKHHITGKPVALMADLAKLCVPDGVILDPFCGSASTGVGALREGRRFVGIEVEPFYASLSAERLAAEQKGVTLSDARAGQSSLFALEPKT